MTPSLVSRGVNELNNLVARKTGLTQELPVERAMDTHARQREAAIAKERGTEAGKMDWPRFAGNLLNPINYVGGFAGPEMKAGMSAVERLTVGMEKGEVAGASAAAMEPATKDNFWKEKAEQIGVGGLAGAATGGGSGGASAGLRAIGERSVRNYPENLTSRAVEKILRRINVDEAAGGRLCGAGDRVGQHC